MGDPNKDTEIETLLYCSFLYLRAFAYADNARFISTFVNFGPCNTNKKITYLKKTLNYRNSNVSENDTQSYIYIKCLYISIIYLYQLN